MILATPQPDEQTTFSGNMLKSLPAKKFKYLSLVKTKSKVFKKEKITKLKVKLQELEKSISLKDQEIKKLKEKLSLVNTQVDQFSFVAAHDLKEPLRMVTSYLGLLKTRFGPQLNDKANTYIDFAIDGGAKLHTMFNSLLDLSQMGRMDDRKKEMDFETLVEEMQINFSKKIKESKAQIKIITKLPVLPVYEKSINRLLENLICNAIKFTGKNVAPIIEISAAEKKSAWEFCVADNGIGIEACHYLKIFAVFSKLHTPETFPGNGIGLAICKKAVEQHGGLIWVDSEIDKGSNFFFTIPK